MESKQKLVLGLILSIVIVLSLSPLSLSISTHTNNSPDGEEACKNLLVNYNRILRFIDPRIQAHEQVLPSNVKAEIEYLKLSYDKALKLYNEGKYDECFRILLECNKVLREVILTLGRAGLLKSEDKTKLRALGLIEQLKILHSILLKIKNRIQEYDDREFIGKYDRALSELEKLILLFEEHYRRGDYNYIVNSIPRVREVLAKISIILSVMGKKTSYNRLLAIKVNYIKSLQELEREFIFARKDISTLSKAIGLHLVPSEYEDLLTGVSEYRSIVERMESKDLRSFAYRLNSLANDITELKRIIAYIPYLKPSIITNEELRKIQYIIVSNKSLPEEVKSELRYSWGCIVNATKLLRLSIHLAFKGYIEKSIIVLEKSKTLHTQALLRLKKVLREYGDRLPKGLVIIMNKVIVRIDHIVNSEIPKLKYNILSTKDRLVMVIRDKAGTLSFLTLILKRKAIIGNNTKVAELANKTLTITKNLLKSCESRDLQGIKEYTQELIEIGRSLVMKANKEYPRLTRIIGKLILEIMETVKRLPS